MKISWQIKKFEKLSNRELYMIIQLRLEVFSVEQNCPYQDADEKDFKAFHLMGWNEEHQLVAYARVLPAGISYKEVSFGRVVTSGKARGKGIGRELMEETMKYIEKSFGKTLVRISAQCYLQKFYEDFGFKTTGEEYIEDNIPHIEMVLN